LRYQIELGSVRKEKIICAFRCVALCLNEFYLS
jgi:hypothetical protein